PASSTIMNWVSASRVKTTHRPATRPPAERILVAVKLVASRGSRVPGPGRPDRIRECPGPGRAGIAYSRDLLGNERCVDRSRRSVAGLPACTAPHQGWGTAGPDRHPAAEYVMSRPRPTRRMGRHTLPRDMPAAVPPTSSQGAQKYDHDHHFTHPAD